MKTTIIKTSQEVIEGEKITLENILIGGNSKTLNIINNKTIHSTDSLILDFNKGEYKITIDHIGMRVERLVQRTEEEGGNYYETLQNFSNEGKDYWRNVSNSENGYVPLNIPFGPKIDVK